MKRLTGVFLVVAMGVAAGCSSGIAVQSAYDSGYDRFADLKTFELMTPADDPEFPQWALEHAQYMAGKLLKHLKYVEVNSADSADTADSSDGLGATVTQAHVTVFLTRRRAALSGKHLAALMADQRPQIHCNYMCQSLIRSPPRFHGKVC